MQLFCCSTTVLSLVKYGVWHSSPTWATSDFPKLYFYHTSANTLETKTFWIAQLPYIVLLNALFTILWNKRILNEVLTIMANRIREWRFSFHLLNHGKELSVLYMICMWSKSCNILKRLSAILFCKHLLDRKRWWHFWQSMLAHYHFSYLSRFEVVKVDDMNKWDSKYYIENASLLAQYNNLVFDK